MDYIKVAGSYKEVLTPYIKVQGKWKESLKEYIKVGGHWSDTSDLSTTKLDYDMTQGKEADGTRFFINKENPTTHKADMCSGNGVKLVAGKPFNVPIVVGTKSIIYYSITDKKFKKVTTLTGTKYSITENFNNVVRVDSKTVVDADITYLDAHPDALGEMFLGKAHTGLSFTKADMSEYYPANEGKGVVTNEVVGGTTKPIVGKWVRDINHGMQNFFFKQDAHGKLIGLAKDGTIETGRDGRWIDLPMVDNTKKHHLVTKCLKEIKGDITQVVDVECTP